MATGSFLACLTVQKVIADDLPSTKPPPAPPPTFASGWLSTITHTVQFEAGIAGNPDDPALGSNFGQLFTDRANEPTLNQVLVTLARPVDETKAWDVGFNLQGLYGSDARYDPTLGI
ncbi:MAG: outer membrane beta-barrel protein, partial [Bradyrhizobium sp.]|nr:outer membrane beta-barrel protein [Bradyrhizobium sp.]